jgi:hypothetical protein
VTVRGPLLVVGLPHIGTQYLYGICHSPDMVKAAQLVHESGTTHLPVTIWTVKGGLLVNDEVNSYLVGLLKKLGYQTAYLVSAAVSGACCFPEAA